MGKLCYNFIISILFFVVTVNRKTNGQSITSGCGTTKTCLSYSECGVEGAGTTNENIATFTTNQLTTYFDIQMQITTGWVAIGISRDRFMPATLIYVCYISGGTAMLESRYASARAQPPIIQSQTTFTFLNSTISGGSLRCKFTSDRITANGYDLADSSGYYILLAYGTANFLYHGMSNRCPSTNRYNLLSLITNGCGTTKTCLTYSGCVEESAGTTNESIATFTTNQLTTYFDIQMPNTAAWVAIGISRDRFMPATQVYVCYVNSSSGIVALESRYAINRTQPVLTASQTTSNLLNSINSGGSLRCQFTIDRVTASGYDLADSSGYYILLAHGTTYFLYHGMSNRCPSASRYNLLSSDRITNGCGAMKTCLSYTGCGVESAGTTNDNIATFTTNQVSAYFDIQMQIDGGWVAIGISRDRFMPYTQIYVCYVNTVGTAVLESRYATARVEPPLTSTQTTFTLLNTTISGGSLRCQFSSDRITADGFDLADSSGYYILLAHGTTYFQYHGMSNRCPSASRYNLINSNSIFAGCTVTKECLSYSGCGIEGVGTTNENIATFTTNQDTANFDIQMQVNGGWVAIGISRDRFMPATQIYVCYVNTAGIAVLESRYATARVQPPLTSTQTTFTLLNTTISGGSLRCQFTIDRITANGFDLADSSGYYILLAHGTAPFQYHGMSNRCPSTDTYSLLRASSFVASSSLIICMISVLIIIQDYLF